MKARLLLAVAAVSLLVAPATQAQQPGIVNPEASTPTILYFHLIDIQDFPINTQKPDDRFNDAITVGLATSTLTCIPNPPAGGTPFQENHVYRGYSSPSYVEYNFEQDGKPRTHPERGISYDALIDQAAPFTLYWYLETMSGAPNVGGLPASPDQAPVVIPNLAVKATIRAGDAISVDDKAYDSGPTLVEGRTRPHSIGGGQIVADGQNPTPGVTSTDQVRFVGQVPNGGYLYEYKIPMQVQSPTIPRATGYNLRIDMFQEMPACPAGGEQPIQKFMTNQVKIHTSPESRPRMEMAIMNPVRLEYVHPQFVGDDLVIHTSMNSAWGNYDVNEQEPDGIQVTVTGPSPATSLAKAAIVQRTHEHYHHQEAVDVTYVWPYKTDRAANGLYTVEVKFRNDQNTAEASGIAQFEVGRGTVIGCGGVQEAAEQLNDDCARQVQADGVAEKDSPGLELVAILGILGAALVVLRRRQA